MSRKIFAILLSLIILNQNLTFQIYAQPIDNSDSESFSVSKILKLPTNAEGKEGQDSFFDFSCSDNPSVSVIGCYIVKLVNILIVLSGITSFGMIVVGGITMVTSAGNETGVTKGKETVTFAVIGLVITLSAYIISVFIQSI